MVAWHQVLSCERHLLQRGAAAGGRPGQRNPETKSHVPADRAHPPPSAGDRIHGIHVGAVLRGAPGDGPILHGPAEAADGGDRRNAIPDPIQMPQLCGLPGSLRLQAVRKT